MFQVGQTISYILLPKDCPTNPELEYHGVITGICPNSTLIKVKLTDPQYEGLEEYIDVQQIRSIEEQK